MEYVDIAVNGALGADPSSDDRDPHTVASGVAAEIARGATIEDACASMVVAPDHYLLWTLEHEAIAEMHARALSVRAQLLADVPLTLARALRGAREGVRALPVGVRLGDLAKALEAEARLTAQGSAPAPTARRDAPQEVRITFDTLPDHLRLPPTVAASAAPEASASAVSDARPGDYVIIEADELAD
jgi:hypothetical protein